MSFRTFLIFTIILLLSKMAEGQDYTPGFAYLEEGKFEKAEQFFTDQIENGQSDLTVRLCYGRAMGLNGQPEEAFHIFQDLLSEFPGNYELELNLAESLMWMKDYSKAKSLYASLLDVDSSSFAATLGYANALSSLREYPGALQYIDKALEIDPTNGNAMVSRKYIMLGLAESVKINNLYEESKKILESLLEQLPGDFETSLSLSYLYMDLKSFAKAEKILQAIDSQDPLKMLKTSQALSSIEMRKLNYKKALDYLASASDIYCSQKDDCLIPSFIQIQTANTYIALKQYHHAEQIIKQLENSEADKKEIRNLKVNLLLSQHRYSVIDTILNTIDDTEFIYEVRSKVYFQQGNMAGTLNHLDSIKQMSPSSVFYHYMSKEVEKSIFHSVNPSASILVDNGGNEVREMGLDYISSERRRLQIRASIKNRNSMQDSTETASHKSASLGVRYTLSPIMTIEGNLGMSVATTSEKNNSSRMFHNTSLSINKSRLLNLRIGFAQQYQDYNVGLIKSNLVENRLSLQYHNSMIPNLGLYAEAAKSWLNDGNSSNFYFVSLFRNIRNMPLLQVGVNGMYLQYTNRSDIYFSANQYTTGELFVKYDNKYHPNKKIIYSILGAFGLQKIDDGTNQNTNRLELEAGYKFNNRSYITAFFRYNNSSSASASGYQFKSIGVKSHIRL